VVLARRPAVSEKEEQDDHDQSERGVSL